MHDGTCGAKNSNFSEPIWRIIFLRSFSKFYGLHPVSLSSKVFRNNGHGRDITTARLQHSLPYAYARHWAHAISPLVKLLRQHRKSRPVRAGKQQFQGPSKSQWRRHLQRYQTITSTLLTKHKSASNVAFSRTFCLFLLWFGTERACGVWRIDARFLNFEAVFLASEIGWQPQRFFEGKFGMWTLS